MYKEREIDIDIDIYREIYIYIYYTYTEATARVAPQTEEVRREVRGVRALALALSSIV